MVTRSTSLAGAALCAVLALQAGAAWAADKHIVGVSWRHFQEERWRIDEAGIKEGLAAAGPDWEYVSADAQSDPQKQLSDVESLIAQGADVLIILAQDSNAILPAIERAKAEHIPVIAYDAPIDSPDAFYLSFDNVAVGRLMADAMVKAKPNGNWAVIKGDAIHPIVDVFWQGQWEVLKPLVDSGQIKLVAQQNVENWKPDVAQSTMEQILTANNNQIDAVLAMNDGMAGGVVAALEAQGLKGVPVSGQDGDVAALNRIARGQQTVSIWKNSHDLGRKAAEIAVQLASGTPMDQIPGAVTYTTPSGKQQHAFFLEPIAITRDNLDLVLDAHWITKDKLCQGVSAGSVPACG